MRFVRREILSPFEERLRPQIINFIAMSSLDGLNYEQFNELLLLFDQDRVTQAFFDFFFANAGNPLKLNEFPDRIARFRGFAMLKFGDFRFAYKKLSRQSEIEFFAELGPYARPSSTVLETFAARPCPALRIEKITKDKTWCLGYIAKGIYQTEAATVSDEIKKDPLNRALLTQADTYERLGAAIHETEAQGLRNTDVYLTWDYMDVYVATSMRKRWEFEETADFVNELFESECIQTLKLRYFDPTQSQCASRIDKGLVEALMLKRALCTVYMVQESDTMGKDSELASTLAQGKPVIAFVPRIDDAEAHSKKLRNYPLEFFKIRFQVLQAEGLFEDSHVRAELQKLDADFLTIINEFLSSLAGYRQRQPLSLYTVPGAEAATSFQSLARG